MSGKFIKFKHGSVTINSIQKFSEYTGMSVISINRAKKGLSSGTIKYNGISWKFETVYQLFGREVKQRTVVHKDKHCKCKLEHTVRRIGNLELYYIGDRLIKTVSI